MDYSSEFDFVEFREKYLIRESYMDTLGHMNNASYIRLFEEARWDFVQSRGYGLATVQAEKISPIVLEFDCKFAREVLNRDVVEVVSKTISYSGKIGVINQQVLKEDGKLACEANFKIGLFDLKSRKLIPPTEKWLAAIADPKN